MIFHEHMQHNTNQMEHLNTPRGFHTGLDTLTPGSGVVPKPGP